MRPATVELFCPRKVDGLKTWTAEQGGFFPESLRLMLRTKALARHADRRLAWPGDRVALLGRFVTNGGLFSGSQKASAFSQFR